MVMVSKGKGVSTRQGSIGAIKQASRNQPQKKGDHGIGKTVSVKFSKVKI